MKWLSPTFALTLLRQYIFPLVVSFAATNAQAAGLRHLNIPGDAVGPSFEALMWTPCEAAPRQIPIEPLFFIPGVQNCPISGEKLPLIIMSPGGGSGPTLNHDTAEALADAGFIVVALRHPNDKAGGMDQSWLLERPTDVKRLIDYMLGPSSVAAKIDSSRVGLFGFSRGGYTGLILAGGKPQYPLYQRMLLQLSVLAFHRENPPMPPLADSRIKAFVIVDPLALYFPDKQSVKKVNAPIQLWGSEKGGAGATAEDVARLAHNLPSRPDFEFVPRSDHSSFAMPCTPAMAKVAEEFCADPPGFDRGAFHKQFNLRVLAFFLKTLGSNR